MTERDGRVLVTGGSGFIAGHCILQLVAQGYRVRTTVRSSDREAAVRAVLVDAGMADGDALEDDALEFVVADLTNDTGWTEAVTGCEFVLHVASPVHPGHVDDEEDVIAPARDGALRVLRAAADAGVRRVVLTSAFHAVGYGHPRTAREFTENDWSVLDGPGMDAYGRSKTLAERAAWDFMTASGGPTELTTMLPVAVMGPVMGREISGANSIIQRSLNGALPGYPNLFIPIVDVRDVAAAHLLAITSPGAAGRRFLLSAGPSVAMKEIGAVLRAHLGAAARRVPTRSIPDVVVRIAALVNREFRSVVPDLGYARSVSSDQAHQVLGWQARSSAEAIVATAESLIAKGLVER